MNNKKNTDIDLHSTVIDAETLTQFEINRYVMYVQYRSRCFFARHRPHYVGSLRQTEALKRMSQLTYFEIEYKRDELLSIENL